MKKVLKYTSVSILIICAMLTIYNIWPWRNTQHIEFEKSNVVAKTAQDNYFLISENNDLLDFPFIFGGKLYLLSIPDGEKYEIAEHRGFLEGIGDACILGNKVFWFETWDQSRSSVMHCTDLGEAAEVSLPEFLYEDYYVFTDQKLYYTRMDETNEGEEYHLIERDLSIGEERILVESGKFVALNNEKVYTYNCSTRKLIEYNLETDTMKHFDLNLGKEDDITAIEFIDKDTCFIQTAQSGIIQVSLKSNEIKLIAKNGEMYGGGYFNSSSFISSLHLKNEKLYFFDQQGLIYEYSIETESVKCIVDSYNMDVLNVSKDMMELQDVEVHWGEDYILVKTIWKNSYQDKWYAGLTAYDYNGNVVYEENNDNLI